MFAQSLAEADQETVIRGPRIELVFATDRRDGRAGLCRSLPDVCDDMD